MDIRSRIKDYRVIFEEGFEFLEKLSKTEDALFVVDERVYGIYRDQMAGIVGGRLVLLKAEERNKNIDTALYICESMTGIPAKRNSVIVSVGGGIIQDITGFAANVLYRGVKWIFVPTTLLASCDSCIGGKTSLNYQGFKNLLGTFYPPDEIHVCSSFFRSLSERDYKSGLGEVVKFNLMKGAEGLEQIQAHLGELLERKEQVVGQFVHSSLEFKKGFIEEDEFDRDERIKLNFAHTFGHAIESVTSYEIPHGTAVAIGMVIADFISRERGLLSGRFEDAAKETLLKVIDIDIRSMEKPINAIIEAMRKDKKQTGASLTAVLMTDAPGSLRIVHDISKEEVEAGFQYFMDIYRENCQGKEGLG